MGVAVRCERAEPVRSGRNLVFGFEGDGKMTEFEVAWTVAVGKVAHRLFKSYGELCEWLERFEFRREFRASVREVEK